MLGPEGAALAVARLLELELPAKVGELAARLEVARLPLAERRKLEPRLVTPFDVLSIPVDKYPAVLVVANDLVRLRRLEVEDEGPNAGQPRYASTYRVRAWVWVRGVDKGVTPEERGADADRKRKRLTLAVREVWLDHQRLEVTLGDTPELEEDADGYRPGTTVVGSLDETTLRESYSDVIADDVSTVAAAWLEVEVTLEELVPSASPAIPVTNVTTTVVHPALAD